MASEVPGPYWKSLLAISTAATDQSSSNEICQPRVLDEENRKWLEQVMSDLVKDTDPGVQLDNVMKSLHCYAADADAIKENDVEKLEDLFIRLEDLLSFAFLTPQFVKNGGLVMMRQFLEKHCESLQSMIAQCILTFTENNPPAQQAVIDCGLLKYMLDYLNQETSKENEKLKLKFLGSVSGTVRSSHEAFDGFTKLNGHKILSKLTDQDQNMKLAAKAARVLTSIAFNLQDSHFEVLLPQVVKSYHSLALRSQGDENDADLENIRDFFEQCVPREKLSNDLRALVTAGLEKEYQFKNEIQISNLIKQYE